MAELGQGGLLEGQADFFGDDLATGQDGDVFEHGLAAVAEARSLDGAGLEDAADVVDHQGGQRFAFDVFSDDQQRTAGLGDLLEHRQQVADVGDFLVEQQDIRIVQDGDLLVRVVDEVGRQVAAVELHTFDDVEFVLQGLAVFNGDDAFLADFLHGLGDDVADREIGIGGNGADLGDFLIGRAGLRQVLQSVDGSGDGFVDAALQVHRVHAGGNVFHAFANDRLGQHSRGGGTVTGDVGGLGSDFLDHLGAHVHELVFQFDFLGDGNTVLGHGRGAERALQNHVAAFRTEGNLDGVGQDIDALDHAGACGIAKFNVFCCH